MTGWEVYVVALMSAHYPAIFRTPAADLVEGLKWIQHAYTRQIRNQRDSAAGRRRWVLEVAEPEPTQDRPGMETLKIIDCPLSRADMKTPSNESRIVGRLSKSPNRSLPKAVREWKTL